MEDSSYLRSKKRTKEKNLIFNSIEFKFSVHRTSSMASVFLYCNNVLMPCQPYTNQPANQFTHLTALYVYRTTGISPFHLRWECVVCGCSEWTQFHPSASSHSPHTYVWQPSATATLMPLLMLIHWIGWMYAKSEKGREDTHKYIILRMADKNKTLRTFNIIYYPIENKISMMQKNYIVMLLEWMWKIIIERRILLEKWKMYGENEKKKSFSMFQWITPVPSFPSFSTHNFFNFHLRIDSRGLTVVRWLPPNDWNLSTVVSTKFQIYLAKNGRELENSFIFNLIGC